MTNIDAILFAPISNEVDNTSEYPIDDYVSIKRNIHNIIRYLVLGQLNTQKTRVEVVHGISRYLDTQKLYDYCVICDQRNNTIEDIDHHRLNVDIMFEINNMVYAYRDGIFPETASFAECVSKS